MKKIFSLGLAFSLLTATALQAASVSEYGDVDTIMEDNSFTDTATRYSAIQLSFFPEYATRLGFNTAGDRLDSRNEERDNQALRALKIVQEAFDQINRKKLSEPKKTEYDMLKSMLIYDTYRINQNRTQLDPLLYSAAFDALYDLKIKKVNYNEMQKRDLVSRLTQLSGLYEQAEKNLTDPASFLSQLAMEKAYYTYLSFSEISTYLALPDPDETTAEQFNRLMKESKGSIKNLFELFKKTAQEKTDRDFRLGNKNYSTLMEHHYFIKQSPSAMSSYLLKNLRASQQNLQQAINRFPPVEELVAQDVAAEDIPASSLPEEVVEEENIAVTEEATEDAGEAESAPLPPQPVPPAPKAKPNKDKSKKNVLANAIDFYPLAEYLTKDTQTKNFISTLSAEASNLNQLLTADDVFPNITAAFSIREMPAYYAYSNAYMFVPPFGTQNNPTHDVFVRLPSGDEESQQNMLRRDFNMPTIKLVVAGQILPGLAYRSVYREPRLSLFRKMYRIPTLRNGWEVYGQHLAQERGYIASDEELLFLAWADYVRAVKAMIDFNLHTQRFTYDEALNWLTENNGFDKTEAEQMIKQVVEQPGEAVSYLYGYDAIMALRAKYQKKLGNKFSLKDFHTKLMSLGDIPTNRLEAEMEHAYQMEKNRMSQALNTSFYM